MPLTMPHPHTMKNAMVAALLTPDVGATANNNIEWGWRRGSPCQCLGAR
jgi:hypothetical protein